MKMTKATTTTAAMTPLTLRSSRMQNTPRMNLCQIDVVPELKKVKKLPFASCTANVDCVMLLKPV